MTATDDTTTPTAEAVRDAMLDVQRRLRRLASLDVGFLPEEEAHALIGEFEEVARTLPVFQRALTAQVVDRGMAETYGFTSPVEYLQAKLGLSRSEAIQRVAAANGSSPAPP